MRPRPFLVLLTLAAAAGFVFASFSTYDFVQNLDRQVHGIHCSFIPGLTGTSMDASSGCHVTMMSPYSSVLRTAIWGGVPIALPAMGVFAYLLFRALDVLFNQRERDRGLAGYLLLAATLPFLTSLVMGYLSLVQLGATCKLCIGIYTSSTLSLIGAAGFWATAGSKPSKRYDPLAPEEDEDEAPAQSMLFDHVKAFLQGLVFVLLPVTLYVLMAPDYSGTIGACGALKKTDDPYGVMVPLDHNTGGEPSIEVLDPLCPSCRAFEGRLESSGLGEKMSRKAILFPLDNTCNWMVSSTLHPGACATSEAVLCAGDRAPAVLDWAFAHQDEIKAAATADPAAAAAMAAEAFPELKSCLGSSQVKSKLNKSLRWAVSNQLAVLTPQVYVNGTKLCDEDTDLGMDYALSRLLDFKPSTAVHAGGIE